jgi:FkbM family methyltransferase
VELDTLDRQLRDLTELRFIKIDVEGGEIDVLRGGERLLRRTRPFVAVEYGSPTYSLYGHKKMTFVGLVL